LSIRSKPLLKRLKVGMQQNEVIEVCFQSTAAYADPYNQVDVDVIITAPDGGQRCVPAFWAGKREWKARLTGAETGDYRWETRANPESDDGLHGCSGQFTIDKYTGDNPLLRHGRLRVADSRRHFEHADGTPFFWTGDTWWMALTTRMDWPEGFQELTADRVAKGFNVIQIVAGPLPDMDWGDPRGNSTAGLPFSEDLQQVRPEYFDTADPKIAHLVEAGLSPCIVGMWGYYLMRIGVAGVKRFWRYLIARYGAYPVTWCIAGEASMPYYLSETQEADAVAQKAGWTEVMENVRDTDGYGNLATIHPPYSGGVQVADRGLMDFQMLQSAHNDIESVIVSIVDVAAAVAAEPPMPVIESEINYEGSLGRAWQNIQRLGFYHAVMRHAAGHTYGAVGIWQMNTEEQAYGPSPHGRCWGNTPWREAAQLPGARQVGLGSRFMRQFPWWQLRPLPDRYRFEQDPTAPWRPEADPFAPVCLGIPGKLLVFYYPMCWNQPSIRQLEQDTRWIAWYFDPCSGDRIDLGNLTPSAEGEWTAPYPPEIRDWLLVLEADGDG